MKGMVKGGILFLLGGLLVCLLGEAVEAEDAPGEWKPIAWLTGSFSRLYFIDEKTGWAIGANGAILHTADGGKNWAKQESGTDAALQDLYFANEKVGWVVGSSAREGSLKLRLPLGGEYHRGLGNVILHTRDGGKSWVKQSSGTSVPLNGLHFLNETLGWVVGASQTLLFTQDGGASWSKKGKKKGWMDQAKGALGALLGARPSQSAPDLQGIRFLSPKVGWIIGRGLILRTADGGESWVASELDLSFQRRSEQFDCHGAFFLDEETGWVVGSLGENPSERESRAEGFILYTQNGGKSWRMQYYKSGERIEAIQFLDSQLGWAIGSKGGSGPAARSGLLLYTLDHGETWTEWPRPDMPMAGLRSLFFLKGRAGWALSERGEVFQYQKKDE
ncbi:MAG: hypothetical protein HYY20_08090 [Candidatus Tectomicrobia bacterium]|uniref:Photosynthesis system II assembly factor Ycf48/Hcf136-like domain-containing protein n=1 Tax=Tectimicrobiota bacterium TaxID=2528274 RepID=A0A932CPA2_UNCTE|nr:hypothetical protein [Candidatus Tectomicrobia bacterium]